MLNNFKYIRFKWIGWVPVHFFLIHSCCSWVSPSPLAVAGWHEQLAQLLFPATSELLAASFWQCTFYSKSLMETDFAVSELSSMLTVAFWRSLKMYTSVDGWIVIKELLCPHEEPVVWARSHTVIHLSLQSSNKCHLYTEATHISLLADIIDTCFSGYIYWLIATANFLRVRSNNKSWWWLGDTLNSQGPWKCGRLPLFW